MPSVQTDKPAKPIATKQKPEFRITIYDAWCKRCGICVEFCPKDVLVNDQLGTPKPVHSERCIGCTQCVLHCPDFAINVEQCKGEKAED